MTIEVRRVVTGHDSSGRSTVTHDSIARAEPSPRPGVSSALLWCDQTLPATVDGARDGASLPVGTALDGGSVFRIVRYDPGVAPRMHRTQTIDYAYVVSGEIDMELDTGPVTLRAGDFLVQRGTIHNWVNRGVEPAVIAFVLIAAAMNETQQAEG